MQVEYLLHALKKLFFCPRICLASYVCFNAETFWDKVEGEVFKILTYTFKYQFKSIIYYWVLERSVYNEAPLWSISYGPVKQEKYKQYSWDVLIF